MAGVPRGSIPASWFASVAGWMLRSAFRRREYTSLISVGVRRECLGWSVAVGADQSGELTAVIAPVVRDADLFGCLADESLGILLVDANDAATHGVIHRLAETLGTVQFRIPVTFAIGAAVSPTHGIHLRALIDHAASHPVLSLRPRFTPADGIPRMLDAAPSM
jgi:hypothetical protein